MDNLNFVRDEHMTFPTSSPHRNNTFNDAVAPPPSSWYSRCANRWKNYRWRMRHYFYIHLSVFFLNTLFWGAIVWRIEDYKIPFIDCWFISATCVFTGGLQTTPYAAFSLLSQILLLVVTFFSGITISTIPAILIKIYRAKREVSGVGKTSPSSATAMEEDTLPVRQFVYQSSSDPVLNEQLQSLPNPQRLRVTSYIILIVVIVSTCLIIHLFAFLAMGFWLKYHYSPSALLEANKTIDPFYASSVITITGFNQNGLTLWSNGAVLFVEDVFMNTVIMLVVISGTSLFPTILRSILSLLKSLSPWKYKIFFDYILLNNHRLSTVIFPSVQTRLYFTVTILLHILGVAVAMIIDFHNVTLSMYTGAQRFMIFLFHVVNTRFGGFTTINISDLSAATLIIFVLLMGIKPQMATVMQIVLNCFWSDRKDIAIDAVRDSCLSCIKKGRTELWCAFQLCTIHETPFEMEWVLLQTQEQIEKGQDQDENTQIFLPFKRMKHYLLRQGSITKAEAKRYFSRVRRGSRAEASISKLAERRLQRRLSAISAGRMPSPVEGFDDHDLKKNVHISLIRIKLLIIIFCRYVLLGVFQLLISTRTWLFIAIFLICVFEAPRVIPSNPTITVFRITFEVVSAFGGCGLSMGFSNVTSSLASVLTTPSKITLIMVMCMGRHRGLLDAMKDQEEIEYSAQTIINSWKRAAIFERKKKTMTNASKPTSAPAFTTNFPTPPLMTRF